MLSASQEIEMNADNPAAIQTVVLQRDDLQNGLLSTCRELSRATAVSSKVSFLAGMQFFFFFFDLIYIILIGLSVGFFFIITKF